MIAYTCDTTDPAKEAANLRWSSEIFPKAIEMQVRLARRLVELGYSEPGLETVLRGFRTDIEIFREENVPLFSELETLVAAYQKITGGLTVDWNGETKTVPQLQPFLKDRDRRVGPGARMAPTLWWRPERCHAGRDALARGLLYGSGCVAATNRRA